MYITPDLDTAERKKRRELQEKLKNKIKEFPDKHWVIRNSQVTSEGEHSKRVEVDVAEKRNPYELRSRTRSNSLEFKPL